MVKFFLNNFFYVGYGVIVNVVRLMRVQN